MSRVRPTRRDALLLALSLLLCVGCRDGEVPTGWDLTVCAEGELLDEVGVCVPEACGVSVWGPIEPFRGAVFVLPGAPAGGDGSSARPLSTVADALEVARAQGSFEVRVGAGVIEVAPGQPQEEVIALTEDDEGLWLTGRCPELTVIDGGGQAREGIYMEAGVRDLELRSLSIRDARSGVFAYVGASVSMSDIRISGSSTGVFLGQAAATLSGVLISDSVNLDVANGGSGIWSINSAIDASDLEVTNTEGVGLRLMDDQNVGTRTQQARFTNLLVSGAHRVEGDLASPGGLVLMGGDVHIEGARFTDNEVYGLMACAGGLVEEGNSVGGVCDPELQEATLELVDVVVEGTRHTPGFPDIAAGLTLDQVEAHLERVSIVDTDNYGVISAASPLTVRDVEIVNTQCSVETDPEFPCSALRQTQGSLDVVGLSIDEADGLGLVLADTVASVSGLQISDVRPHGVTERARQSRAMLVTYSSVTGQGVRIQDIEGDALGAYASTVELSDLTIDDIRRAEDALWGGLGVSVPELSTGDPGPSSLTLSSLHMTHVQQALAFVYDTNLVIADAELGPAEITQSGDAMGIFAQRSTVGLDGVRFTGLYDHALFIEASEASLVDVTVSQMLNGSGLSIPYSIAANDRSTLNAENLVVRDSDGVALLSQGSTTSCQGCTLHGNTFASVVFNHSGSLALSECTISGTSPDSNEGGGYGVFAARHDASESMRLRVEDSEIGPHRRAAVLIDGDIDVQLIGNTLSGGPSSASSNQPRGQAVFALQTTASTEQDVTSGLWLSENVLQDAALGALFLHGASATLSGNTWSGNGVDVVQQFCGDEPNLVDLSLEELDSVELCPEPYDPYAVSLEALDTILPLPTP